MSPTPIYRDHRRRTAAGFMSTPRARLFSAVGSASILAIAVATLGYGFGVGPTAGHVPFASGSGAYSLVPDLLGMLPFNQAPATTRSAPIVRPSLPETHEPDLVQSAVGADGPSALSQSVGSFAPLAIPSRFEASLSEGMELDADDSGFDDCELGGCALADDDQEADDVFVASLGTDDDSADAPVAAAPASPPSSVPPAAYVPPAASAPAWDVQAAAVSNVAPPVYYVAPPVAPPSAPDPVYVLPDPAPIRRAPVAEARDDGPSTTVRDAPDPAPAARPGRGRRGDDGSDDPPAPQIVAPPAPAVVQSVPRPNRGCDDDCGAPSRPAQPPTAPNQPAFQQPQVGPMNVGPGGSGHAQQGGPSVRPPGNGEQSGPQRPSQSQGNGNRGNGNSGGGNNSHGNGNGNGGSHH